MSFLYLLKEGLLIGKHEIFVKSNLENVLIAETVKGYSKCIFTRALCLDVFRIGSRLRIKLFMTQKGLQNHYQSPPLLYSTVQYTVYTHN